MSPPTGPVDDFSTNRHSFIVKTVDTVSRHPDLSFDDGNIALLAGAYYFIVHQGLLCRQSPVLNATIKALEIAQVPCLEGRAVLQLQDSPDDLYQFLLALYDGISFITYGKTGFPVMSALLRLLTKYQVNRLRAETLRGLSVAWPTTLAQWEARETKATNARGVYAPRDDFPHPIAVINLARAINALEILPSAFYDLSRCLPSAIAFGYHQPSYNSENHQLSDADLLSLLKGREHASRFLSTFIVNELEGRESSALCLNRKQEETSTRRACQIAFESITFELLRDINGLVCNRCSDPLYAILDSELMQTRENATGIGVDTSKGFRACEYCRAEYGIVVDTARDSFWRQLPHWFGVELVSWA